MPCDYSAKFRQDFPALHAAWCACPATPYETDMGKEEELQAAVMAVENRIERMLQDLETRFDRRIENLITRADGLEEFVDGLELKLDALRERLK